MHTKECTKCLEIKPINKFYIKTDSADGFSSNCKLCRKEYEKKRYENNVERFKKRAKLYRKNNPNFHRKAHLKKLYNITLEEYNILFNKQEGCCAICCIHQSELNRPLCVDHDHNTNIIRGLLCKNCNSGIGLLKENKMVLYKAIEYLNNINIKI